MQKQNNERYITYFNNKFYYTINTAAKGHHNLERVKSKGNRLTKHTEMPPNCALHQVYKPQIGQYQHLNELKTGYFGDYISYILTVIDRATPEAAEPITIIVETAAQARIYRDAFSIFVPKDQILICELANPQMPVFINICTILQFTQVIHTRLAFNDTKYKQIEQTYDYIEFLPIPTSCQGRIDKLQLYHVAFAKMEFPVFNSGVTCDIDQLQVQKQQFDGIIDYYAKSKPYILLANKSRATRQDAFSKQPKYSNTDIQTSPLYVKTPLVQVHSIESICAKSIDITPETQIFIIEPLIVTSEQMGILSRLQEEISVRMLLLHQSAAIFGLLRQTCDVRCELDKKKYLPSK